MEESHKRLDSFKEDSTTELFHLFGKFLKSDSSHETFTEDDAQIFRAEMVKRWPELDKFKPNLLMLLSQSIEESLLNISPHYAYCFLAVAGNSIGQNGLEAKEIVVEAFEMIQVIMGRDQRRLVSNLLHPPMDKVAALIGSISGRIEEIMNEISQSTDVMNNQCGGASVPMPAEVLYERLATAIDQDELRVLFEKVVRSKVYQITQNNCAHIQALELLMSGLKELSGMLSGDK